MFNTIISMAKAKKSQKNTQKTYPTERLYVGYYQKTITEDDSTFTYQHYDCFYADGEHTSKHGISKLIRITGDNLTNKPIHININSDNNYFHSNTCIKDDNTLYYFQLNNHSQMPKHNRATIDQINDNINQLNNTSKTVAKSALLSTFTK